ncbi:hypothetical protein GCM10009665_26760 [Kitasatospora nipponensis]|uniref:Regulator of Ras-like GTPase activity (Roadblock/LC7/MglB family) n=1 Tax=Kitasatospora nipponensis TaxID=258049 RepID=A0ABP4GRJ6_9ACTN
MAHMDIALRKAALLFEGAIGMALVDADNGVTLGALGGSSDFDLTAAATGNAELLRTIKRTAGRLGLTGSVEDILITLNTQYHLIRPLTSRSNGGLFLYLALDRRSANLAMARHQLVSIEGQLSPVW